MKLARLVDPSSEFAATSKRLEKISKLGVAEPAER
jgi:hypothetical protein